MPPVTTQQPKDGFDWVDEIFNTTQIGVLSAHLMARAKDTDSVNYRIVVPCGSIRSVFCKDGVCLYPDERTQRDDT